MAEGGETIAQAAAQPIGRPWVARRALLLGLLGAALLNLLLTFENLWPTPWVRPTAKLSLEALLLIAALGALRALGVRAGRALQALLTALVFLAVVLRYTEVTAPPLFGRGLDLYWDLRYVPDLIALFWRSAGSGRALLAAVGLLAGTAALIGLIWLALGWIERGLADRRLGLGAVALGAVASLVFAWSMSERVAPVRDAFAVPSARVAAAQIGFVAEALRLQRAGPDGLRQAYAPGPLPASDLKRLEGAPVFIVFVESYGTSALDDPRHFPPLAPTYAALRKRLAGAGWHSASGRLISPTFGGGSWLAHSTLLSGIRLSSQALYNLFANSRQETMATAFRAAGYRAVLVMPGTRRYWPEGKAYGFDKIYDAAGLGYPGPDFGFWRIPDQFTLQRFHDLEVSGAKRPLFAAIALIMSHMPFHPLPPYVADWSKLEKGTAYDPAETARLVAEPPDWSALSRAYVDALRYDLRILGDFVTGLAPPDALVIVLGDHQPPALVTGEGQPWTVPIHLLARDAARLRPFLAQGYRAGLIPSGVEARPMERFFADFFTAFDSGALQQAHLSGDARPPRRAPDSPSR